MQDAEPIFPTEPSAEPALPVTIAAPPQEEDDDFPRAVAAQALGDPKNLQQLQDVLGLYLGVPIRLAEAGFQVLVYFELAGAPPRPLPRPRAACAAGRRPRAAPKPAAQRVLLGSTASEKPRALRRTPSATPKPSARSLPASWLWPTSAILRPPETNDNPTQKTA